jgi:hypothetical protein
VDHYAGIEEIFGTLGRRPEFRAAVAGALTALQQRGSRGAVAALVGR